MITDREKWNQRYADEPPDIPAPDPFLVQHNDLLKSGRALDLACGRGGNAIFLAESGYAVDAVDISDIALARLQVYSEQLGLDIRLHPGRSGLFRIGKRDRMTWWWYSIFFSERLLPSIKHALRQDGLLFYATYNERHTSVQPGFNPDYLVEPRALTRYFIDFEILVNEPVAGPEGNISRLIARKII